MTSPNHRSRHQHQHHQQHRATTTSAASRTRGVHHRRSSSLDFVHLRLGGGGTGGGGQDQQQQHYQQQQQQQTVSQHFKNYYQQQQQQQNQHHYSHAAAVSSSTPAPVVDLDYYDAENDDERYPEVTMAIQRQRQQLQHQHQPPPRSSSATRGRTRSNSASRRPPKTTTTTMRTLSPTPTTMTAGTGVAIVTPPPVAPPPPPTDVRSRFNMMGRSSSFRSTCSSSTTGNNSVATVSSSPHQQQHQQRQQSLSPKPQHNQQRAKTTSSIPVTGGAHMITTSSSFTSSPRGGGTASITTIGGGGGGGGSITTMSTNNNNNKTQQRSIQFLNALGTIYVPPELLRGVEVIEVSADGSTRPAVLRISEDKFTVYVSPVKQQSRGFFGGSSGNSNNNSNENPIDIGEMDRIQRGQSTKHFEKANVKAKQQRKRTTSKDGIAGMLIVDGINNNNNNTNNPLSLVRRSDLSRNSSNASSSSQQNNNNNNASNSKEATITTISQGLSLWPSCHNSGGGGSSSKTSHPQSQQPHGGGVGGGGGGGGVSCDLDPQRSFSIIFRGIESVDLLASSFWVRNEICDLLDRILQTYQHAKIRVAPDVRLLRYIWLEVDQQKTGYINEKQLRTIFKQINYNITNRALSAAYEQFGRVIGLHRAERKRGITFEQSLIFLHKIKRDNWIMKPVNIIWNELFGELMNNGKQRMTVSEYTFLTKFLHQQQGQYDATITDVRVLFRKLHNLEIAHITASSLGTSNAAAAASPKATKGIQQHSSAFGFGGGGGGADYGSADFGVGGDQDSFVVAANAGITTTDFSRITKDHFEAYLFANENDAFDPIREEFDVALMNQPLSEYWINSSHNTYLMGDQIVSNSSVEMYTSALYRGCRCLELDCFDGGKEQKHHLVPVVRHGRTMTSSIRFDDIIRAIRVFLNFHPDTLPIILSFENHCSIPYQEIMANMLLTILGDELYIPTESSLKGQLPTPIQLRGMVIIKGRRPDGTEADTYDTDDDMPYIEVSAGGNVHVIGGASDDGNVTTTTKDSEQEKKYKRKHGIAPSLARITLLHGFRYKNFVDSVKTPTYYMHSFSESKVEKLLSPKQNGYRGSSSSSNKYRIAWNKYNETHLTRTYPDGMRVDSTNYNPILAWSVGCQLVALNFQTQDTNLRLNDGRFRENGNCGYVLKKRNSGSTCDDSSSSLLSSSSSPMVLTIRVLCGSCLPKPKGGNGNNNQNCIDPYVRVTVYDVRDGENRIVSYPTNVVQSNGFFPIWCKTTEKFIYTIDNPAVAMIQFTVYDFKSNDEFVASSSIPISCIRRGIRSVKLYDKTNTRSGPFDFASLLIDIKMKQRYRDHHHYQHPSPPQQQHQQHTQITHIQQQQQQQYHQHQHQHQPLSGANNHRQYFPDVAEI